MQLDEVMQVLESWGTAQNRKIYARHGVKREQFGVSTANIKTLQKKIKRDHALAVQLWETGNYDARVIASMIIDPAQITEEQADRWVLDVGSYAEGDYFANVILATPFAVAKAEAWARSDDEWIGTVGWGLLARLAYENPALPDSFFLPYLERAEREIHTAKNRVRYEMNQFVIAVGVRNESLRPLAEAVAQRVGKVQVDHGETSCKTPDALSYMKKIRDHREQKQA